MTTPVPAPAGAPLEADARNRGWRTILQGLGVDVAIAIALFVTANLNGISDRAALIAFGVALAKTVVMAVAAYVLRRYASHVARPPGETGSAAAWYGLAVGAAVVVLITLFTLGAVSAMIVGALLAVGGFALHEALDDRRRDLSEAGEVAWVPLIIGAVAVVVLLLFLDAVGVISMGGGR